MIVESRRSRSVVYVLNVCRGHEDLICDEARLGLGCMDSDCREVHWIDQRTDPEVS